mmetsp:Transcript_57498/g.136915  ORF Transcript_57498/g.136915 Transcript_57498/m.136915 type:complete len:214 (+) Transcript_57498:239-880(+)
MVVSFRLPQQPSCTISFMLARSLVVILLVLPPAIMVFCLVLANCTEALTMVRLLVTKFSSDHPPRLRRRSQMQAKAMSRDCKPIMIQSSLAFGRRYHSVSRMARSPCSDKSVAWEQSKASMKPPMMAAKSVRWVDEQSKRPSSSRPKVSTPLSDHLCSSTSQYAHRASLFTSTTNAKRMGSLRSLTSAKPRESPARMDSSAATPSCCAVERLG